MKNKNKKVSMFDKVKSMATNKKLIKQILKFGIVGAIAFLIDYVILIICKEVFGLSVLISAATGFIISVIINYILSVKFVFEVDKAKSKKRNFIIFIVFSVMGLGLTELIMWLGVDILKWHYLLVKIVSTGIVMVFNFVTRKLFLESRRD